MVVWGLCLLLCVRTARAQTTTWIYDGNGNWSTASHWDAGVPTAGSLVVIDDGDWPARVYLDYNPPHPISGLTIGSDDRLYLPDVLLAFNLGSTIVNDGEIALNAGISSASTLRFLGDVTVTGTGQITMTNNTVNLIEAATAGGSVLTQEADHTIHGGGKIGSLKMGLVNYGTVEADQEYEISYAPLRINPGTGVDIGGTDVDVVNSGVFRASNAARLLLSDGVFDNTGGVIEAVGVSSDVWIENAEVRGGQFVTDADGQIMPANHSLVRDVTLTASSTMQINNIDTSMAGTFTNNGTISQAAGKYSLSTVEIVGDVTLAGSGQWDMTNNTYNYIFGDGTNVLTNGANHTIHGAGRIGNNNLGFINEGLVTANEPYATASTPLRIMPGTGVNIDGSDADVVNNGTMRSENAAILRIQNGEFLNNGTVEALDASHVEIESAYGTVTLNNVSGVLTGGNWRAISTGSGALLKLSGDNLTQIAAGTVVEIAGPGSAVRVNSTPIENTLTSNAGDLVISGGRVLTFANAFENQGLLAVDAASGIDTGANDLTNTGMLLVGLDGTTMAAGPGVTSTATASLSGTLVVTLESGYEPSAGDVIPVLGAGSVVGAFDEAVLPKTADIWMGLVYEADAVSVQAAIIGDLNADGYVGLDDLQPILGRWNQAVTAGVWSEGDPSGDGYVGLDDLQPVLDNWNNGTLPSPVPEPIGVLPCLLLTFALSRRRGI